MTDMQSMHLSSLDISNLNSTNNFNTLRLKISEIIENSTNFIEKRNFLIRKELDYMKNDYLSQLNKIYEFINSVDKSNLSIVSMSIRNKKFTSLTSKPPIAYNQNNKNKITNSKVGAQHSPLNRQKMYNNHNKNNKPSFLLKEKSDNKSKSPSNSILTANKSLISASSVNKNFKNSTDSCTSTYSKSPILFGSLHENLEEKIKKLNKNIIHKVPSISSKDTEIDKNSNKLQENDNKKQLNGSMVIKNNIVEHRKFSILDIEASSLNFIEDRSLISNRLRSDFQNVKSKGFTNKKNTALYIVTASKILPYEQMIKISSLNRELSKNLRPEIILADNSKFIRERIDDLENEFTNNNIEKKYLFRTVSPSKTAQYGLNFLTKELETQLFDDNENLIINKIFKLIHILLSEQFDEENNNIIKNLFDVVLPKYNASDLKMLFTNVIYKTVYMQNSITNYQLVRFKDLIENNQILINPGELVKINLPASYLSFSMKEIYDYLTQKIISTDLESFPWRLKLKELKFLQKEYDKLQSLIK